jgi:hypothetical protein
MALTEVAVQGVEIEQWAMENIADLQAHFDRLLTRLEKGAKKHPISNVTEAGGVTRGSMRVGFRAQGGAGIQQFAADTSSSVAVWPRGTGSYFDSFIASPVRLINVCEISNLAQQATDGKDRGMVRVRRDEMEKSLLAYDNGVEGILNRDGSGTIDQIPLSGATVNNGTGSGGAGSATFSSITGLNTAASFSDQQTVQVLSAVGGTNRGSFVISFVDPVAQTIYSTTVLPSGTTNGDILVIQGASGAAGSSIYGKDYWLSNGNTGTLAGIPKANYPGRLSTPTINFNNSGSITNSTVQRVEAIRMRALGDEYDENESAFWYTNPSQGVALSNNYYEVGYTRLDENGERVVDTAKKFMQETWGGRDVVYASTAEATRMDLIVPDTFVFGELFPTRLHEWTPGNTIAAVPAIGQSAGSTYFDSIQFGYERGFQIICQDPKKNFYLQQLPVPTI